MNERCQCGCKEDNAYSGTPQWPVWTGEEYAAWWSASRGLGGGGKTSFGRTGDGLVVQVAPYCHEPRERLRQSLGQTPEIIRWLVVLSSTRCISFAYTRQRGYMSVVETCGRTPWRVSGTADERLSGTTTSVEKQILEEYWISALNYWDSSTLPTIYNSFSDAQKIVRRHPWTSVTVAQGWAESWRNKAKQNCSPAHSSGIHRPHRACRLLQLALGPEDWNQTLALSEQSKKLGFWTRFSSLDLLSQLSSSGCPSTTPGMGLRLDLLWSYERLSSPGSKGLVRANCKSPTYLRGNALLNRLSDDRTWSKNHAVNGLSWT